MSYRKFIILFFVVMACVLGACVAFNYVIDPLYFYHRPWFGLKPFIMDKRYQIAGMARNFAIENAVVGNSLAENILQRDLELTMGGSVTRLTAPGSHPLDWRMVLNILRQRHEQPKKILLNLDPYIFNGSTTKLKHSWPMYLYDKNPFNDVNYLLNFEILWKYSFNFVKSNRRGRIPTLDEVYTWKKTYGRHYILEHTQRQQCVEKETDTQAYVDNALENVKMLTVFFETMPNTEFIFFCSPFSILYWDNAMRGRYFDADEQAYYKTLELLLKFPNVHVYFWDDEEMMKYICDLDCYRDESHFEYMLGTVICKRIAQGDGLVTNENRHGKLERFFKFLKAYNYDKIWEN